jgi:antitoxin FitA
MSSVQIDDIPDDIYKIHAERAKQEKQSLQDYLRARLIADAKQSTLQEELNRANRGG